MLRELVSRIIWKPAKFDPQGMTREQILQTLSKEQILDHYHRVQEEDLKETIRLKAQMEASIEETEEDIRETTEVRNLARKLKNESIEEDRARRELEERCYELTEENEVLQLKYEKLITSLKKNSPSVPEVMTREQALKIWSKEQILDHYSAERNQLSAELEASLEISIRKDTAHMEELQKAKQLYVELEQELKKLLQEFKEQDQLYKELLKENESLMQEYKELMAELKAREPS